MEVLKVENLIRNYKKSAEHEEIKVLKRSFLHSRRG